MDIFLFDDLENKGIRLLKKGKVGILRVIFSRVGIFTLLLVIQLMLPIVLVNWFSQYVPHYVGLNIAFIFAMVIYLLNSSFDPTAKITWLILIMVAPVFGAVILLFTRTDLGHRAIKKRLEIIIDETQQSLKQDPQLKEELNRVSPETEALTEYMKRSGCFPIYKNTPYYII